MARLRGDGVVRALGVGADKIVGTILAATDIRLLWTWQYATPITSYDNIDTWRERFVEQCWYSWSLAFAKYNDRRDGSSHGA